MSRRRNRPSAFEVSFNEKLPEGPPVDTTLKRRSPYASQSSSQTKRPRMDLPAPALYVSPGLPEVQETEKLVIPGEELSDPGADDKPVRILDDFSIFDPKRRSELVSLQALEEQDGLDGHFVATGFVTALMAEGDEDEEDEDGDDELLFVRLGAIFRVSIDCSDINDPVWVETQYAWYILRQPSQHYHSYFRHFYLPRRVTQLVISAVNAQNQLQFIDLLETLKNEHTILGQSLSEDDLFISVDEISRVVVEKPHLRNTQVIKHLLHGQDPSTSQHQKPSTRWSGRPPASLTVQAPLRNLDSYVLQSENQVMTHVTPLISKLAASHFGAQLMLVGAPLASPTAEVVTLNRKKVHAKLRTLVAKAHREKERRYKKVIRKEAEIDGEDGPWMNEVGIEQDVFQVGDVAIITPDAQKTQRTTVKPLPNPSDIPVEEAMLQTYFWFAKIISLNAGQGEAHVQWFEHSSFTAMQEFGHPQQLYLNHWCSSIPFESMVGVVKVHYQPKQEIPAEDFFYNSVYDHALGSVTSIPPDYSTISANPPPYNCPVCQSQTQNELDGDVQYIHGTDGFRYMGHTYHLGDFILVHSASPGPCDIGQIIGCKASPAGTSTGPSRTPEDSITVYRVGRMQNIVPHLAGLPSHLVNDERHVYMTNEKKILPIKDIIRPCIVLHRDDEDKFSRLIKASPNSFYTQYHAPSLEVKSFHEFQQLRSSDLASCKECLSKIIPLGSKTSSAQDSYEHFLAAHYNTPLRTLDLFSGCGAFSLGMSEGGDLIKVMYGVEIAPSAAETFIQNLPGVTMFNNCANIILRYFIKAYKGHSIDTPQQLYNDKPLPPPLKPGDIDLILIGFPCQSHSGLNKYKKANDPKSNLILTALSFVDFLRPKYCYFENVRGFLQFNTSASQAGVHRLEGGIKMGGLKFLLRALDEMGYQYQFSLLQAAHYGTPQSRVRFFLVAAQHGYPLPKFPQPSHYFPLADSLTIPLPIGVDVSPIKQVSGSQPHRFVTIEDAISDLPRFDWQVPGKRGSAVTQPLHPAYLCDKEKRWCGPSGQPHYFHPPKTAYQAWCRRKETENLQQFTKVFLPATVERVTKIPLQAGADYRGLPANLHDWQLLNPVANVAKRGHKGGMYGRLDETGWFPTTVTNVNPTAKQSKVLNPWCKRIVTIRELARSQGFPDNFMFIARDDSLVTMHRHIGNAVPWPVSMALGRELAQSLYEKWLTDRRDAILVD